MRYAELHCRTNFSFLEGASHPAELVQTAAALGYAALAITDRDSLAGVVRAHGAAKDAGLPLIIGAEVTPAWPPPPGAAPADLPGPAVVLWATDRISYGRLCRLLTLGRRRAAKGQCDLTLDDVAAHAAGLLAGLAPPRRAPRQDVQRQLAAARDIFGDRGYLLAELHYGVDDAHRLHELQQLSRTSRLPLVAAGDVHYHAPQRMVLQQVLTAIRHGVPVAQLGERCLPNAERHLRPLPELRMIYARAPEALRRTGEIAQRCRFSLQELRYEYPEELAPPGESAMAYLRRLAWQHAAQRFGDAVPPRVAALLTHELQLIEQLRYEAFFLTVYDVVQFARSRDILCQGRGSAANSAVCYVLGITAVDPAEHEMLFERFVSAERNEAPDIDVDFEHERREEVLQYIYQKYGRERAALAATVITYQVRSAVRDVGKALGLSLDRVDLLAKNVDHRGEDKLLAARCAQSGVDPGSRLGRQLIALAGQLVGFPRHLSQHVGGMVMTRGPLCELAPVENAAMADRTIIPWDKDDLDELGILKVDCLALGMLTALRKGFALVEAAAGRRLSLDALPGEDPAVYAMISRADTVGVFQIESRAQMSMLPRLKPATFYDLVIEVAIVRPGPIQGNMVHPYLRRRNQEEPVEYPSPEVEDVLRRTLGVPLFQEQAMRLAVVAAGFTGGEADQLRRAMGAWRRTGMIDDYRRRLVGGMLARGYAPEFAERLFEQIRGFGEYGFPESHAASFAKLVYASAWLKHYYPAAFTAALINSQPMGFYAPAQLVRDAQEHGVEIRPVDVGASHWDCTLEPRTAVPRDAPPTEHWALRLGLRLVAGLPQEAARAIVAARTRPYGSVAELARRARLGRGVLRRLADADALRSLAPDRRAALWQALDHAPRGGELPLWAGHAEQDDAPPPLPPLSPQQQVHADYHAAGLSLRGHPLAFVRAELDALGATQAAQLTDWPTDRPVRIAGLVLMRQRPGTAKGITFVTLEDETGSANLIVHPRVWKRCELAARRATALLVTGRVERKERVIHVIASRLEDMAERLQELRHRSRDFR